MNKQDYLIKKGIIPHPDKVKKVFYFRSDREGVSEIEEISSVDIRHSATRLSGEDVGKKIFALKFEKSPYELEFLEGGTSAKKDGYASGFGDLWCWSQFGFFNREDAEKAREEELKRITDKYLFNI